MYIKLIISKNICISYQMEFWVSTNHYRSTKIQLFHGYKMLKVQYLCKVMPPFLIN